ncbi:MAG: hypothetical protein AB8F65_12375 [Woeseiaceae bacterium]
MTLIVDSSDQPWLDSWYQLRIPKLSIAHASSAHPDASPASLPTAATLATVSSRLNMSRRPSELANAATGLEIVEHFSQRFEKRWQSQDATHLARLKLGLASIEKDPGIRRLLNKIETLFDSDESSDTPSILLVATRSPEAGSLATLDTSRIFVESPVNESAANRFPVIVHESIHWRQSRMSRQQQALLINAFLVSESDCTLAAYHLFDEVVATSIGNGVIEQALNSKDGYERYLALPLSFYGDHNIDTISKQLSPIVENYIDAGKRLDPDFVHAYLLVAEQALGTQCNEIGMEMGMATLLLGSPRLQPIRRIAQHHWKSSTLFTDILNPSNNATMHQHTDLSGVIVATRKQLQNNLKGASYQHYEQIKQQLVGKHARFVFAERRERHARLYWVVADTEAEVAVTFMQFLEGRPERFDGLWIPPDTL